MKKEEVPRNYCLFAVHCILFASLMYIGIRIENYALGVTVRASAVILGITLIFHIVFQLINFYEY